MPLVVALPGMHLLAERKGDNLLVVTALAGCGCGRRDRSGADLWPWSGQSW